MKLIVLSRRHQIPYALVLWSLSRRNFHLAKNAAHEVCVLLRVRARRELYAVFCIDIPATCNHSRTCMGTSISAFEVLNAHLRFAPAKGGGCTLVRYFVDGT